MPWQEMSRMSQRAEFVALAQHDGRNLAQLSRRYGISRKTAYKWLQRYAAEGVTGLRDRSRRPHASPTRTAPKVEAAIVAARQAHPAWGARKLWHWLRQQQRLAASALPAPSTIHAILQRHGQVDAAAASQHRAWHRFEHAAPNQLWQMDFKGDFRLADPAQTRCFALTVLDDHSRFALGVRACWNQRALTVQAELSQLFRCYGLPARLTMDNGSPWGDDGQQPYTQLTVWLLRLGIGVSHSRPYHPQTQGKDERFHRTLQAELLRDQHFADAAHCQRALDDWRQVYHLERPHQALGYAVPAQRYQPSPRLFPEVLPPITYRADDLVRKVEDHGRIHFKGQVYRVSKAFQGQPVALRPLVDDEWQVWFCQHLLGSLNRRTHTTTGRVTYVPEHV